MPRRVVGMAARSAPVEGDAGQVERIDEAAETPLAVPVVGERAVVRGDQRGEAGAGDRLRRFRHFADDQCGDRRQVERARRSTSACLVAGAAGERRDHCCACFVECRGRQRIARRLDFLVQAERVAHEFVLVDQQVGRRAVRGRRETDSEHGGAPVPATQLAQHRREVGVGREDDELVVAHLVLQEVDDVEHHVDVGAGLAFAGQRRTVDDLEAGKVERRAEALVGLRVEVAAADQHAPARAGRGVIGQFERAHHPLHPRAGAARELLGGGEIELAQGGIDVVEVDEQGTFH